jgi:futalosine hydrolase
MKKILLVAATDFEIAPFVAQHKAMHNIEILITGIGQLQTTFELTQKLLQNQYDLVLQAGIAGAFDRSIPLGTVVEVESEILYDLSIQDKDGSEFDFFEAGFLDRNKAPFVDKKLMPQPYWGWKSDLRKVKSITVNKVHGEANAIQKVIESCAPDIENMEGAALFYVCAKLGMPCVQLRAISNYVEPRNRANWNISLAIKNLNDYLMVEFG